MNQVIGINRRGLFSYEEAQALLPVIFRITKTYHAKVQTLVGRLERISSQNHDLVRSLELQTNQLVLDWQNKVQKLGVTPKGLWIADFDAGDGYFCWKYPERDLGFWHRYDDGYSKRVPVSQKIKTVSSQERHAGSEASRLSPRLPPPELSE